MFRHLIRWGAAALLIVSFAQPARALPLGGAEDGFVPSFSAVWEYLLGSFFEIQEHSGGTCDPNGGICPGDDNGDVPLGGGGESSGTCDPNGGGCFL